jgi:nuclease S1
MQTRFGKLKRYALAFAMCLWSLCAQAWGTDGHQVVALIAETQLTAKTRAAIEQLLALEPGQTLASVSSWADEHRSPATAAWHYVNFPRDTCQYLAERDCPDGKCVVGAIERQLAVLKSSDSDERRLLALKYIVHFVADVHQPLHAGYADDRGGNAFQLQAFMRGTNLHSLWDSGIIKSLNETPEVMAARLSRMSASVVDTDASAASAAQESCQIVGLPGYYPGRRVGQDYIDRFTPVLEARLGLAGKRLGRLLNMSLP